MIEVLLVDDQRFLRDCVIQLLHDEPDIRVTGEAYSGHSAMVELARRAYDVVLLDISLPDQNGFQVLKAMRKQYPEQRVLMLTGNSESEYSTWSLRAGAAGFVTKDRVDEDLAEAIREVVAGNIYVTLSETTRPPRDSTMVDRTWEG